MFPEDTAWLGFIHPYGLMIAIGLLCAFGVLFYYGKKIEAGFIDFVFYNGVAAIVFGFGSAALFQAVYDYIETGVFGFGGITFIGGLIGGIVTFVVLYFIFRKKYKTKLLDIISALPCSIMIGHAFGRIGCFCAGCCYGAPTDSIFGIVFPYGAGADGLARHPTMLYEAAFLFILFAITFYLVMKKDFQHNLSVYLIGYGIFRFFIEYVRDDYRGSVGLSISPSQLLSVFLVIGGIVVYFLFNYLRKNHPTPLMKEKALGLVVEETLPPITSFINLDETQEEAETTEGNQEEITEEITEEKTEEIAEEEE